MLLAVLFTLLNSLKPVHIDDAAYYYYAAHIAEHPLDPYGFEIHWYQHPLTANHVLAPPVLPYWWAAAIRLFGDRPFLWKLWLFPISLLFVLSLDALFRRFAAGLELPLVTMTALSPTFLPSMNLMLDVPALALGLASLTLFFEACDRAEVVRALGAGFVGGLAMQTKYTAFLAPATMVLYSVIVGFRKPGSSWRAALRTVLLALVAAIVAGAVFLLWESYVAWTYGESHFLHEYRTSSRNFINQLDFGLPLLSLLGGVASPLALLALIALGQPRSVLMLASSAIATVYAVMVSVGAALNLGVTDGLFPVLDGWRVFSWSLDDVLFAGLGLLVAGTVPPVAVRVLRQPGNPSRSALDWFLITWLALEITGYFVLTPFAATRRVMGVVVVGTLLASRLAATTWLSPDRMKQLRSVVVGSVVVGLIYYGVDLRDAWAGRKAAEDAAALVRRQDPAATIWYTGHWGFQFYAERSGMKAVVADRSSTPLCKGDWLVIPDDRWEKQEIDLNRASVELVEWVALTDGIPLRTVRCFYGTVGAPLEHHNGPRREVTIYRVTHDFVPLTPHANARDE
jgi:hypothetical protein